MRLLITDDSKLSRLTIKHFFDNIADIEITEAANGIDALDQHRIFKPDVIFLDITMPQLDGIATLKIINMIDKAVKVIIVTSIGEQRSIQVDCKKYGALAVLSKPVEKEAVLDLLHLDENK